MKVSFKLTKEQQQRAKQIVAEVAKEEMESQAVWCGNLLGFQGHSFSFNSNQHLDLLDNGVIRYVGHRHPLIQDGGLDILARIAGFSEEFPWQEDYSSSTLTEWVRNRNIAVRGLVVNDYQTSDAELDWWETASDKAWRLVKEGKVTAEMLKPAVEKYCRIRCLSQAEWAYMTVLDGVKPAPLGTPAYRQACAAGTQEIQLLAAKYQEAKNFWY